MGLIKTGLTLAGSYGLIKAASKAVSNYEDKKQQRVSQSQPSRDIDPQTNYGPNQNYGAYYQNQQYETPTKDHAYASQQHFNQSQSPPAYYQSQLPNGHQPQINYAPNMNGHPPY